MLTDPINMNSALEWARERRPDIVPQLESYIHSSPDDHVRALQDAMLMMLGIGFEAGRFFQAVNPTCTLNLPVSGEWNSITDEVRKQCKE